uniref:Uncharacterized protein n=1 Tax=Leersia perrieri TaxID=77586 RepID=A0A0D9WXJ1_9ORYZ
MGDDDPSSSAEKISEQTNTMASSNSSTNSTNDRLIAYQLAATRVKTQHGSWDGQNKHTSRILEYI